jgi:hypothetical protein
MLMERVDDLALDERAVLGRVADEDAGHRRNPGVLDAGTATIPAPPWSESNLKRISVSCQPVAIGAAVEAAKPLEP